jgi:hypothetical protein
MSFEEPILTIKTVLYIYYCMKIATLLGDRFILLVIMNIFVFYAPIEKKCPHFLFISRMYIKQIIEGIIGLIESFIPRYKGDKPKKE